MVDTTKRNVKEFIEKLNSNVKDKFEFEGERFGNLENKDYQIEQEMMMTKLREELLQKFKDYKTTLNYMAADAPIGILCLPKPIENVLIDNGILRIYDVFDVDFTKIKGLGVVRVRHLTACLDQFFSML